MTVPIIPAGNFLLPVCIESDSDIVDLVSALDLYRVMRKKKLNYPAFDAVLNALDYADNPQDSPCLDIEGGTGGACFRMDTTTEIFQFYPNNPFDSTDESKTPIGLSWARLDDIIADNAPEWLKSALDTFGDRVGYFPNDVFLEYDLSLNPFTSAQNFYNSIVNFDLFPFPIVKLEFEGIGQVEIEFPQVPLGGSVIVAWDYEPELNDIMDIINGNPNNLDNFQVLELQRDIIGIPPEFTPTVIFEVDFTEEASHTIQCFFTPSIQPDQAPFLFPFAGIREVEICGNIQVVGQETGTLYDGYNYKLESHREGVIGIMAEQDLYDALVRWENQRAKRWLLGFDPSNFENGVDITADDGKLTSGTGIKINNTGGSLGGKPVVDATQDEIVFGGAMGVGRGFRDLVGEIILRRQTQSRAAENVSSILRGFYQFKPIVDTVDLFANLLGSPFADATDQVTPAVIPQSVANIVYCNGASKASLYRYALEIEDTGGTDVAHIADWYRLLIDSLEDEQIDQWYQEGSTIPDARYVTSDCHYRDPVTVTREATGANGTVDLQVSGYQTIGNRIIRITASGKYTASSGEQLDAVYFVTTNDVAVYQNWTNLYLHNGQGGNTFNIDPPLELPYSEDNTYSWTVELQGATPDFGVLKAKVANIAWLNGSTGSIDFTFQDLGKA